MGASGHVRIGDWVERGRGMSLACESRPDVRGVPATRSLSPLAHGHMLLVWGQTWTGSGHPTGDEATSSLFTKVCSYPV